MSNRTFGRTVVSLLPLGQFLYIASCLCLLFGYPKLLSKDCAVGIESVSMLVQYCSYGLTLPSPLIPHTYAVLALSLSRSPTCSCSTRPANTITMTFPVSLLVFLAAHSIHAAAPALLARLTWGAPRGLWSASCARRAGVHGPGPGRAQRCGGAWGAVVCAVGRRLQSVAPEWGAGSSVDHDEGDRADQDAAGDRERSRGDAAGRERARTASCGKLESAGGST
jgi:hypothetical protein